jgi:hypothetical protein
MPSRAKPVVDVPLPDPGAVVRYYPNPQEIIRAYVESDFARALAVEHERLVAIATAEGADVTDAESYVRVGDRLVELVEHRRTVTEWFKPLRELAYRLHRMVCDRETTVLDPIVRFEQAAKTNRLRLEREEAEARRREEQRLAAAAREQERERLAREAADLEERMEPELAAQVLEQAVHVPAPVVVLPSTLPVTPGISSRPRWLWRPVGGEGAAAKARAIQLVPREFLTLDTVKINAYVRSHGASARIPGIEIYDAGSVTVRT